MPSKKPLIIVMVGLPRSGKSTWAKRWSKKLGAVIVCPDSVRLAMHGNAFIEAAEPFVWATTYAMIGALIESGHKTLILDATNTTLSRRAVWERKFPNAEIQFKYIPTKAETCMNRARSDARTDLVPVIKRMEEEFEALTEDEKQFQES